MLLLRRRARAEAKRAEERVANLHPGQRIAVAPATQPADGRVDAAHGLGAEHAARLLREAPQRLELALFPESREQRGLLGGAKLAGSEPGQVGVVAALGLSPQASCCVGIAASGELHEARLLVARHHTVP